MRKISVIGLGYVGMSLATLLSLRNNVVAFDLLEDKRSKVKNKVSTIVDSDIDFHLANFSLNLSVSDTLAEALTFCDYLFICTPTNYDVVTERFDTSSVDSIIHQVASGNYSTIIVIKSTIPIGYVERKRSEFPNANIIFCPEFLQEGTALKDNLKPSRIVVGDKTNLGQGVAEILLEICEDKQVPVILANPTEAEAVKLFANTYLAMRVAFFNELDSFAMHHSLNSKEIIESLCEDRRIGKGYNNPSFGYGGYCLPKDTKQLLTNFGSVPCDLIKATISSNSNRKSWLFDVLMASNPKTVGFYRLVMKKESDNFRESASIDLLKKFIEAGVTVIVYEPLLKDSTVYGSRIFNSFKDFEFQSDIIIANRKDKHLLNSTKVFTRDVFEIS